MNGKVFIERLMHNLGVKRQKEVAAVLGVPEPALSKWVNGHTVPDADKLITIASRAGCSIDYLLNNDVSGVVERGEISFRSATQFIVCMIEDGVASCDESSEDALTITVSDKRIADAVNTYIELKRSGFGGFRLGKLHRAYMDEIGK